MFEALRSVPVMFELEEWTELKVVEAAAHGTAVKPGTVLIRLDTKDLDRAIRAAKLEVKLDRLALHEAQAKFERLDQSQRMALKAAEDADRIATEELKEFLARGRGEQLEAVKQSEISSSNRLAYEEEELKQLEKMYAADDLTEDTEEIILKRTRDSVDAARYGHKVTLSSARQSRKYAIPRAKDDLEDAVKAAALALQETRESQPRQRRQQELQLQKQQDALAEKEKHLDRLRTDRKHMQIKATHDGVVYYGESKRGKWTDPSVIEAMLQPGGSIKPKAVVMTIVQTQPLRLRVAVPEAALRQLSVGAQGTVSPIAFPDAKLEAKVRELTAIPVADGLFDAVLDVNTAPLDGRLVPGMKAKLTMNPSTP